jgi:hypothetical protein
MVEPTPDFDEFFGSLIDHGVEFLVVGAYALAFHGVPRYTGEIDVFVRPDAENAQNGREIGRCGSRDLSFIGRPEFVRNKRAAGRLKDLADLEALGDQP